MKTTLPLLLIPVLLIAIGCQNPCTKTTFIVYSYSGDTIFTERAYPNCDDTLTYHERQVKRDSTVIAEGEVVSGKKEGIWETNGWMRTVTEYKQVIAVKAEWFHDNGKLMQEEVLGADSLYKVRSFYEDGTLESESYQNLDGYLTGSGIDYDTLGRKMAEGEYIAEPCLTDTIYIESPEPPYDLQMTIVEELGGKHGPWLNYDSSGNVTDTVVFDRGVPVGKEVESENGAELGVPKVEKEPLKEPQKKSPGQ